MVKSIEKMKVDSVIIGGDFNTIMLYQDIKGGRGNSHPKCTNFLNSYAEAANLVDIWRIRHPDQFRFTFNKVK